MKNDLVDGEVWINSIKQNVSLSPLITDSGFWLKNQSGYFQGPNIIIKISPNDFSDLIDSAKDGIIDKLIIADDIGQIDDHSGYVSVDIGSFTRKITRCNIAIWRLPGGTRFELSGKTGLLLNQSVSPAFQEEIKLSKKYTFKVWFKILDKRISNYFKDNALETISRFIALNKNNIHQKFR